jgi:hypothetical protein
MHRNDIDRLRLQEGDRVTLVTAADDGIDRRLGALTVIAYDIPEGCCAGYYPECNVLVPLWHHAERAKVPAAKSVPVRIFREGPVSGEFSASSDMISGNPLSNIASDLARATGIAGRAALRGFREAPVKMALIAAAAGLAVGAAAAVRRHRRRPQ